MISRLGTPSWYSSQTVRSANSVQYKKRDIVEGGAQRVKWRVILEICTSCTSNQAWLGRKTHWKAVYGEASSVWRLGIRPDLIIIPVIWIYLFLTVLLVRFKNEELERLRGWGGSEPRLLSGIPNLVRIEITTVGKGLYSSKRYYHAYILSMSGVTVLCTNVCIWH